MAYSNLAFVFMPLVPFIYVCTERIHETSHLDYIYLLEYGNLSKQPNIWFYLLQYGILLQNYTPSLQLLECGIFIYHATTYLVLLTRLIRSINIHYKLTQFAYN